MQSCQFAKSVTLNAGQEGSAPHGLLSFSRLRSSRPCFPLQPQTVQDAGNEAHSGASASVTVLEHTMLFSHVLGLRTPILRQGDVTDSFYSVHFFRKLWKFCFSSMGTCIAYYMVSCYLFLRFGGSGRSFACVC